MLLRTDILEKIRNALMGLPATAITHPKQQELRKKEFERYGIYEHSNDSSSENKDSTPLGCAVLICVGIIIVAAMITAH